MIADRRDLFLVAGYLIKILQWAGHQPLIQNCAHCEKERSAFSSDARVCVQFETGAWICPECTDSGTQSTARPISIQVLDAAYLFLSQPYRVAANVDTYASLSSQFFLYSQHLGQYHIPGFDPGQLKSLNFLKVN